METKEERVIWVRFLIHFGYVTVWREQVKIGPKQTKTSSIIIILACGVIIICLGCSITLLTTCGLAEKHNAAPGILRKRSRLWITILMGLLICQGTCDKEEFLN